MPIKLSWLSTGLIVGLSFSTSLPAHSGRTASDGCHYCRTNCDKWGVPWVKDIVIIMQSQRRRYLLSRTILITRN